MFRKFAELVSRAGLSKHGALAGFGCNGDRVWGGAPSGGPKAEPPVGGQWAKPPEAECLFHFVCPKEATNLPYY